MAYKKVQSPATSLYTGLSAVGTSCLIKTPVDLDGNILTMAALGSTPQFTIDPQIAGYEEIIGFTGLINNGNGTTTVTGLSRDLASSSLATPGTGKQHGAGATIVFSLNPQDIARMAALENDQTFTGVNTFSASPIVPNPPTNDGDAIPKKYIDDIVQNGGLLATDALFGVAKLSVAAADAATPISVGDNDGRIPTIAEKAALAGTGTPSSGNKYVTEDNAGLANNVKTTGDQTIAGVKTFTSIPVLPASDPTTDNQAARKKYVDDTYAFLGVLNGVTYVTDPTDGQKIYYNKLGKHYLISKAVRNGPTDVPIQSNSDSANRICTLLGKTLSSYIGTSTFGMTEVAGGPYCSRWLNGPNYWDYFVGAPEYLAVIIVQ